ncbi:MAG: hypothetical protein Q8Q20_04025 [bacterium]|nr:hypothetical protein [bacterium]
MRRNGTNGVDHRNCCISVGEHGPLTLPENVRLEGVKFDRLDDGRVTCHNLHADVREEGGRRIPVAGSRILDSGTHLKVGDTSVFVKYAS